MRTGRPHIRQVAALALFVAATSLGVLLLAGEQSDGRSRFWIGVSGDHLVDGKGKPTRLLGVNRSSGEYECLEGKDVFEGPIDEASIEAMKSWRINVVRLPLNESCWLGINGVAPAVGGDAYRAAVRAYVERLEAAGLYVILELQWAAPGSYLATEIIPMPDADHAPAFWRSLATEYRDDRRVLFDLYNEPHGIDWECWEWGCDVERQPYGVYRAVGMRRLVKVVRSTGARQPLLLGGINWSNDLGGWLEHLPPDPAHALVASVHTYDFAPCYEGCREVLATISERAPVITGELGEEDCNHDYTDSYMDWADLHGISYLGWAWNIGNGWTCTGGPSLIDSYDGDPSEFGIGLRNHLRKLRPPGRR
jgi:hypothetical protein